MVKNIVLNDWDLEQIEKKGYIQSGELIIIKKEVFDKIFDDTFIRLDDKVKQKFIRFCKQEATTSDVNPERKK